MKLIIQRVNSASVKFEDGTYSSIGKGMLVYVAFHKDDSEKDIEKSIKKLLNLRIFENEDGKLHYNIFDMDYEMLIISNFSIYGNLKKGNRPSFTDSADSNFANKMYELFIDFLSKKIKKLKTGKFKTNMQVSSINDGPLNFIFDTREGD